MSFTPTLFISVGEHGHFFTLRETYQHFGRGEVLNGVFTGEVEIRSFHHFNLSRDPDEAFAKAAEYAQQVGLKLTTRRESLAAELAEIRRASAEELAAREAERAERYSHQPTEAEREWLSANVRWEEGEPVGFAASLLETLEREGGLTEGQLAAVRKCIQRDAARAASRHLGAEGERITVELKVERILDWSYGSFPTIYRYCNICRDPEGNVVKYIGSNQLDDGVYKVTVKEHGEYRGEKQTIVQRPKLIG